MRRIPPFPCRRAPGIQTRTDKGSFVCTYTSSINQLRAQGVSTESGPCQQPPPLPLPASQISQRVHRPPGWPLWAPRSPLPAPEHGAPAAAGGCKRKAGYAAGAQGLSHWTPGQEYKGAASPFARPQTSLAPDAGWRRDSANSYRGPQCRRCSAVCEPWVPVLLSSSTGPPPKPPNGFLKFLEQNPHSDQSSFP